MSSATKSIAPALNDVVTSATNKEAASRVSYGRAALLSMAELDACKTLPPGFDSSILRQIDLCASTPPQLLILDSDCSREQNTPSQSSTKNPELEISRKPLVPRKDDASATSGTSAINIEGSGCYLLKRGGRPYQPPSLRKMTSDSDKQDKDSYKHSILGPWTTSILNRAKEKCRRKAGIIRDRKTFQEGQQSCAELTGNFPEIISIVQATPRNNGSLISSSFMGAQHNLSSQSSDFENLLPGAEVDQNKHCSSCASGISRHSCEQESGGKTTNDEEGECNMHPAFSEKVNSNLCSGMSSQMLADAKSRAPRAVTLCAETEKTIEVKEVENDLSEAQCKQSCDMRASLSLSGSCPGGSEHLISVLTKGRESRDLKDPVADALNQKISGTRVTQDLRKDATFSSESYFTEVLHSTDAVAKRLSALTEDDFLGFVDFSDPVAGDISLPSDSANQISTAPCPSVSDDVPAKFGVVQGGQTWKSSCEEDLCDPRDNVNEIFLPEEDSLITLEDLIMSMDLIEKPDVNSSEEQLASSTLVDTVQNPNVLAVSCADDASQPDLGSDFPSHDLNNACFCSSYDKPGGKPTSPLFDPSQGIAKKHLPQRWQNVLNVPELKCLDPKAHSSDRPLFLGFPATTVPDPFLEPYAVATQIRSPAMNLFSPEMAIPVRYPAQQFGLVSGVMLGQMEHDPINCCWRPYGVDMNGVPDLASRIPAAPANWFLNMGGEAEPIYRGYPWSSSP